MKKTFITNNSKQTQELGERLAGELQGGEIICLSGELGSGKTTFTQGVLKGLGAKGPHTSPTFIVMRHYNKEITNSKSQIPNKSKITKSKIQNIYHIDAYRVSAKDILALGWEEIISNEENVVIVEWAEKIKSIVPKRAVWIKFDHKGRNRREITIY